MNRLLKKCLSIFLVVFLLVGLSSCSLFAPPQESQEGMIESGVYVYMSIECTTILKNMENLQSGLEDYVPEDGIIIKKTPFQLLKNKETGKLESPFDLLLRTCSANDIMLDYTGNATSIVYVRAINHLYEKSCGSGSGWLYYVNNTMNMIACNEYVLSNDDYVAWKFTCNFFDTEE